MRSSESEEIGERWGHETAKGTIEARPRKIVKERKNENRRNLNANNCRFSIKPSPKSGKTIQMALNFPGPVKVAELFAEMIESQSPENKKKNA